MAQRGVVCTRSALLVALGVLVVLAVVGLGWPRCARPPGSRAPEPAPISVPVPTDAPPTTTVPPVAPPVETTGPTDVVPPPPVDDDLEDANDEADDDAANVDDDGED